MPQIRKSSSRSPHELLCHVVLGRTSSEIESSQGSFHVAMPTENLTRHFVVTIQSTEGEFDLHQVVICRITVDVGSGKIFLLNTLDWFWDQWENRFLAGVAKVFGNRNFHS